MTILPGWSLSCPACGFTTVPDLYPRGCPACLERCEVGALLVEYDAPGTLPPAERTSAGMWKAADLLPAVAPGLRRSLGEGDTPLVQVPMLSEVSGCERLYLKMESQNPTAAHKDRLHAVASAVGKALGYEGIVSNSTGNHGFSMASYAAAHKMHAIVVANQRMPLLLQRAIRFAGGLPLLAPPELGAAITTALVEDDGWYPASTSWPMPMANPYGVEGYKTIGYEIYHGLGGRLPDLAFLPAAGGDGLVGMWRAVADLRRIGLPNLDVRICPAQPAGAAPMVAALERGLDHVPFFPDAYSRALSIGDPTGGWLALRAVRETNGFGVAVSDDDILATGRVLARNGLLVEPSSAASVAGALQALRDQPELREQTIVCVITSSGLKWLDDYETDPADLPGGVTVQTVDAARAAVDRHITMS